MLRTQSKKFFLFYLVLTQVIAVSTSCQCIGYEPLLVGARNSQFTASSVYSTEWAASSSKSTEHLDLFESLIEELETISRVSACPWAGSLHLRKFKTCAGS
ncbi:hypothetical protein CAPTEDRAFT_195140 [Capitella teleta]|uniref:Uncharacterized protein n=1 Tax=Capitella teleta TaxID=283909 RepID=R7VE53_CAPTE|nr:hypothetical protein CAPTEDRAFT_195140 [Capitella teleta]|eukprot:ELU16909.1 hypothetical protein CAPTEDRAFT_195140 [Capitella teleta]